MTKQEPKITKRTVFKGLDGKTSFIAEPWTAPKAEVPKKQASKISASQARRLIRDLEYFVETGELSPAKYEAQRAAIVARIA